jgi:hypothetical protein
MKKTGFLLLLLVLALPSYADGEIPVCIEGFGTQEQVAFFGDTFAIEVVSYGYELVDRPGDADYSIRYVISSLDDLFILEASLVRLEDNYTVASNAYYFNYLEDMLPYNQLLVFSLVSHVPHAEAVAVVVDDSWRDKKLYLRASVDFPITIYRLLSSNVSQGNGMTLKKDNMVVAYFPAITLGAEARVTNWLNIEPVVQVNLDTLEDGNFLSFAAGLQLKFPLKPIRNIMLEPYLAGLWTTPLTVTMSGRKFNEVFDSFPQFGAALGLQIGIKNGKSNAIFFDVSYAYYFDDARVHDLITRNSNIDSYQRSVVRFGVGYKFGLGSRK